MSDSCRRSLLIFFSIAAMMIFSVAAFAECDTECDPYTSSCSQYCDICTHYTQDGCDRWRSSTCGEQAGGCIPSGCTPNWQETSRVAQGTYDGRSINQCTHHTVYKVTVTDQNSCNENPYFYSYWYCDDVIDGQKYGFFYPSCCDGRNDADDPDPLFTCDGNHSCY